MTQQTQTFLLQGGLNLVTPAIQVPAGQAIGAVNYVADVRGYRRIDGYERLDGQPKPSDASYWVLNFDAGVAAITEGQTVTGATSGATGKTLIDAVISTGAYATSNAAGYLVLTAVTGTFQDNENLQVGGVTKSVANGVATENGATTDANNTTWTRDAIATARALIAAPTGSGAIRGVFTFGGDKYCIRDNAGATAAVMFKATTSGWTAQSFGHTLDFDGGTVVFVEGATLTGGTSGATGVIRRMVKQSGAWTGTAAGYLVLSDVTGTFQDNEAITGSSSGGTAVANGTQAAIALPAGGHYETIVKNFFGATGSTRVYGVSGVGYAFEFDGTYYVPIRVVGLTSAQDKPSHIAEYKNHLFLGYAVGSSQFSGPGEPLSFETVNGAGEIAFGQALTGLLESASSALVFLGRSQVSVLTGDDEANFILSPIADDAGGVEWTAQVIGGAPLYMDDLGVRRMTTTTAFGNWRMGTLTQQVQPIFDSKKAASVTAVASLRVRSKDQYLLFWSDGTALSIYLGRKNPEPMPLDLPITVSCAHAGEDSSGNETLLVGASDGFVYELNRGTSFDGAEVEAWVRLAFNNVGAPSVRKRFHKATLEIDGSSDTVLSLTSECDYGSPNLPSGIEHSFTVQGGGGFWDDATWNDFYWSSTVQGLAEAYVYGIGRNISITILSDATHEEPHTLTSLTLNYSPRGLVR